MTITLNLAQFQKQLQVAYQNKVITGTERAYKDVVGTVYRYITINSKRARGSYGSPVLTGRYHASHRVSLNGIDTSYLPEAPRKTLNYYKELDLSKALSVLNQFKLGDTTYIANSVPYARDLEFSGASRKTPRGIYMVSVEAAKTRFKRFSFSIIMTGKGVVEQ